MTTMGQGKEMPRLPCTPRDSKAMSHTAVRCRCRPSGPGGTFWVQAGSGCLGATVTRSRGGFVWAWPKLSRDGMGTTSGRGAAMGIVTQQAIRLQTSDFYGPSPPTPNPPSPP